MAKKKKTLTRGRVIQDVSLVRQLTDCQRLGEIREVLNDLISLYGEDAEIMFDSGYNNICERVRTIRDETDEEFEARKKEFKREIEAELKEQRKALVKLEELLRSFK